MTNSFRYDFDSHSQLTVEMPMVAYDKAMRRTKLGEVLEDDKGFVSIETHRGGVLLTLNKAPFKNGKLSNDDAEAGASRWLYAINSTRQNAPDTLIDRYLDVHMSYDSPGDLSGQERLGFHAELKWPLQNYERAQRMATLAMQDTALTFGYLKKSIVSSAYAVANREQGVELQALDAGCSCVTTDGMTFDPTQERTDLYGHNLYSRRIMLTCLTGLVALARTR
jgi:hypothetical protein